MGKRLTKIYTRTGDRGETGLALGDRVPKDGIHIEAIGAVDELNCTLGVLLAEKLPDDVRATLTEVQHRLFDLGGELSMPGNELLHLDQVTWLEDELDRYNAKLPPLEEFILPAGGAASARCHVARATCRHAERRVVTVARDEQTGPAALAYLNRLSDLLFVLARVLARGIGEGEVYWRPANPKPAKR